jgi:DNA-binding transcriptional MocR family regulator
LGSKIEVMMEYGDFLYERVANDLAGVIQGGTFRPGERIPSVREMSRQRQVSITTVMQAYQLLEDRGLIEVRPQSGYFVRPVAGAGLPEQPAGQRISPDPAEVSVDRLVMKILRDVMDPKLVQFGTAIPDPDLLPTARLNRILAGLSRRNDLPLNICGIPQGCLELRTQVAQRSFTYGCQFTPDDLVITAGCMEAVSLALRVVCRPGDTVAVESPTYFNMLQALEAMDLRVLEIPTHPTTGVSLEALRFAIEHHPIRACLFMTNFSNPLGATIPEESKKELVELLAKHEIPLIEDDIHGELNFNGERPKAAKAFDKKGLVLLCSSFSKDLAPGYRIGWIAAGRYRDAIERMKMASTVGTAILPQYAISEFLENGGYDHHLRRIRRAYAQKMACMSQNVLQSFPEGTHISSPAGGFVLWVQLPETVDSLDLYRTSLKAGISLVPGYVFSAGKEYRNFIRLNAAYWCDQNAWAVHRIGELAAELANQKKP